MISGMTTNCDNACSHIKMTERKAEKLAEIFKALGHPVRVRIVAALMDGERCVCELQRVAERDISTVSSHLNILKNTGILACEQRGKQVFYRLKRHCLAKIFSCLLEEK